MDNDTISRNLRSGIYRCVKPKKNGKLLKSPAWNLWHWIRNDKNEIINGKIACIHCFTVQKYKSTAGTSNLLKHKDSCLNTDSRKSLASLSNNEIQTIKSSVNEKVVQFVAQDLRPLRVTSCPGFLSLADKLISIGHHYGPVKAKDILPHRTTVPKLVRKDRDDKRQSLMSKLIKLQSQGLAITLDLWTEDYTKGHYIGMNVHYISKGILSEATLCVKELEEISANAVNIHIEIINMLDLYGIDINNVAFVTDRGPEIIAALKDYAFRLNCGAHILKNIVDEMLNKISANNLINSLLESCRSLVKYTKKSGVQSHLPNSLKNEVQSRWNATLSMIKSIEKAQETNDLKDFLELKERSDLLTDIDNELLDELIGLLDLFQEATLHFEVKKQPTIHFLSLYRVSIEEHLLPDEDDSDAIAEMKIHGLAYLRENWILDDFQKKAVFFHPKLKRLNMFDNGDQLIEEIRKEAAALETSLDGDAEDGDADDGDADDRDAEDDDEQEYQPPRKRRKVNEEDSIIDEFCNSNFSDQPLDDVQQYLNSFVVVPQNGKIDLCKFWYEHREMYPALYKLSLKYLCVPASSATAESKFSLAGFLVNERRVLLDPDVVDSLMLLKSFFDSSDLQA